MNRAGRAPGIAGLILLSAAAAGGAIDSRVMSGESAPTAQPAGVRLSSLSWMAGSWGGEHEGTAMEEHWTSARGRLMLGMHRDIASSGRTSFEFMRIEERADGLVFVASPGGKGATEFRAVESGPRRVVFENPQHDFPRRILYWAADDGRLHARVEGPPSGEERPMEWAWERMQAER